MKNKILKFKDSLITFAKKKNILTDNKKKNKCKKISLRFD